MPDFIETYRRLRGTGVPINVALRSLVNDGAGFIDCIKAVRDVESVSLADAKNLVHCSEAWRGSSSDREAWWSELEKLLAECRVTEKECGVNDIVSRFRSLRESGSDSDQALAILIRDGVGLIDCIKAVREVESIGLSDAKHAVEQFWESNWPSVTKSPDGSPIDPVLVQILRLIDSNPGMMSWYQLDRSLSTAGNPPGKKLLTLLDAALRSGWITATTDNPSQPFYRITPEGKTALGTIQG